MKYIGIDSGKFQTKGASYNDETRDYVTVKFRTKASAGEFRDDMLGAATYLAEVDGKVYKVGYEARKEAELETSKKSEIHKVSTLATIASILADGHKEKDFDEAVNVVAGIPYQTCCVVSERLEYKDYILPKGPITVTVKRTSTEDPIPVTFHFEKRLVYPESIGVTYMYPKQLSGVSGIVDIGNLNINNTYCDSFSLIEENSFTDEMGGKILISGLAQQLSSEMGARVSDDLVAKTLMKKKEERFLVATNGAKGVAEKSKAIIDAYLLEHVEGIKRKCDARHWPLSFMNIVVIGGTAELLKYELREVFGENIFIPERPEFVNVEGFLKKLCADCGVKIDPKKV